MKESTLWYPRYVGDYSRKTRHLTLTEHGAYVMLMDHYYSTKQGLPAIAEHLHRICSAVVPLEQDAVMRVVNEFFYERDGRYYNDRVEEELDKRKKISEARAEAARKKAANAPAKASANDGANAPAIANTTTTTYSCSKEGSLRSPSKPPEYSNAFEDFWAWFPRQRRGRKEKAWAAYQLAIKERGATEAALAMSVEAYRNSDEVSNGYAKGCAAWLSDDRWEVDYEKLAKEKQNESGHNNKAKSGGGTLLDAFAEGVSGT